ncbi:MAG: hypothetical protein Q9M92_00875 [Enterobacterales bacterium]|nr:hypothetical protein [Enterobacterales bacterium]
MSEPQQNISQHEASDALKSVNSSQQDVIINNQAPIIINLLAGSGYASIVFGYGMTEHGNLWALAMWVGAVVFILSISFLFYTYRLMGIKPTILPRSSATLKLQMITGILFALLVVGSREFRLMGFQYAPHLFSVTCGLLIFIISRKYPTGEFVSKMTLSSPKASSHE